MKAVENACKTEEQSLVLIGSFTFHKRTSENPRYLYDSRSKICTTVSNYPNGGMAYLKEYLPKMITHVKSHGKEIGLSVSDETIRGNMELIKFAYNCGVKYFEINTNCEMLYEGKKVTACYHEGLMSAICKNVKLLDLDKDVYLALKVGAYNDFHQMETMSQIINPSIFQGIVTMGTIKGILMYNGKTFLNIDDITRTEIGGKPLRTITSIQIANWVKILPNKDIIGVGGISSYATVKNFYELGAVAMQVGSAYFGEKNMLSSVYTNHIRLHRDLR
jgi:dihydroorotate dehydrogenase